ncbi:helix-turn-helix transcriptional regulator [Archaeoglobus veneficus]|nr:MarR family transcriptional regulator [Archaeoglobus veneficus]
MMKLPSVHLLALALIVLCASLSPVEAATIHGVIYNWENLEPLPKAVVIVNTTPEQRLVTKDGTYSFNLSPGNYVIKAFYYRDGKLELYAEENVTITDDGDYIHDIILFPPLEFSVEEPEVEFPAVETSDHSSMDMVIAGIAAAAGTAGVVAAIWLLKRSRRRKEIEIETAGGQGEAVLEEVVRLGEADAEMTGIERAVDEVKGVKTEIKEELPDDLVEVIEVLRKEGGRLTQKELRKRLGYSEAKMSLIVADLERRGIIEKVKKGRGNIIFLREL